MKGIIGGTFARGCQIGMQGCMLLLGGYCLFRKAALTKHRAEVAVYGQTQLGLDSVLVGCEHAILHKTGIPELPQPLPIDCGQRVAEEGQQGPD